MIIDYRTFGEAPQMGRNLFVKQDSKLSTWGTYNSGFSNFTESTYSSEFDFIGSGGFEVKYLKMDLIDGQDYTLAFDFTRPDYAQYTAGQGIRLELRKDINDVSNINSPNVIQTEYLPYVAGTSRIDFTFTAPSSELWICLNFGYVADAQVAKHFKFANFKMEFGTIATAWTAAPEDNPNLILNSAFLKDMSSWVKNGISTDVTFERDASVMFGTHPSVKIRTISNGYDGGRSNGYPVSFKPSTTYILSCWAYKDDSSPDGTVSKNFRLYAPDANVNTVSTWNVIDIYGASLPNKTWKQYSLKFTTAATSTRFTGINLDFNAVAGTACIWIADIKLEESTAVSPTAWTPAPEDVLSGSDRKIIATGQKSIIDWNDSVGLTARITSNLGQSQKYNPATQVFTPDWVSTNLVLTASLFKNNSTGDIINETDVKSIRWFRKTPIHPESELTGVNDSYHYANGKTLTRKQNLENSYGSMEFRVEVVYTDPISNKDVISQASITFNISIDAGGLTQAVITTNGSPTLYNGRPTFITPENEYGRNLITNSSMRENITGWNMGGQTAAFETVDGYTGLKVTGAFNTTKYINQSLMGKINPGETYTASMYVRVENIVVGTTNPFIALYLDGSYNNAGTNTWFSLGATSVNTSLTGWQKITVTFTTDATKISNAIAMGFYGYARDFTGTVWFRDFKFEKGTVATDWSIAPQDRPAISQATGESKWLFRRYNVPTNFPYRSPNYDDTRGRLMNDERLVNEGSTLYGGPVGTSDYYIGYLGTSVYVPTARDLPLQFNHDDTISVYVNNQIVASAESSGVMNKTVSLIAGWNTLELLYHERAGGDGIWNFATTNKQVMQDAANLNSYVVSPSGAIGTKQGNKFYRYVLGSDTEKITNTNLYNVLQGSMYTISFLLRTDSTDLSFSMEFTDGADPIFAPMVVDLGIAHASSANGSFVPVVTDLGDGIKRVHVNVTTTTNRLQPFILNYITSTTGTYFDIGYPKLELGATPTEFSYAPEDVAPSILKTHVEKVNTFYTTPFETYLDNLTATCKLWRASILDETDVTYQWYKKDETILTDQGGGIGWLKLSGASIESGYNLQTLVIPGNAVDGTEVYKCIVTDTQLGSSSINQNFSTTITIANTVDPIEVMVTSTNGSTFRNGQGETILTANVYRKGIEMDIEGIAYTYKWYRYKEDATKDTTWNNDVGYKTGKKLTITPDDLVIKATFSVEVIS